MKSLKNSLLLGAALAVLQGGSLFADSPRKALIETFVNANAEYTANRNEIFSNYYEANLKQNAIVLSFHPAQFNLSDGINRANPTMHAARYRYYGLDDQPLAQMVINGTPTPSSNQNQYRDGDLADTIAIGSAIEGLAGSSSPITLAINQSKTGNTFTFKVTVSSSSALNGKKLRFAVAEYFRSSSGVGTNGETEFRYIARQLAAANGNLDTNGIFLNLAAGGTQEFTYTFTPASSGVNAFNPEFLYGVAFVQDDESKEVLQAESSAKPEVLAAAFAQSPVFFRVDAGQSTVKDFTVRTSLQADAQVDLSIDTVGNPIPAGWSIKIEPSTITVPADGEANATVEITAGPDKAAYYVASILSKTKEADGFNIPLSRGVAAVLSTNTRNFVAAGYTRFASTGVYSRGIAAPYDKQTSIIPWNTTVLNEYTDLINDAELLIIPIDANPVYLDPQYGFNGPMERINAALDQGKKVLVVASQGLSWAFDPDFPDNTFKGAGNDPLAQEFYDRIGIEFGSRKERTAVQGGGTVITPFTVRGVANDAIGNRLNNNAVINANAFTAENFFNGSFMTSTDIIKIKKPDIASPIAYYDNTTSDIAGIRATLGDARIVYLTFHLETLGTASAQNEIIRKSVNWLRSGNAASAEDAIAESTNENLSLSMSPNPAAGMAQISYSIKGNQPQLIRISVVDALGNEVQQIMNGQQMPGNHSISFDASNLSSGAYRMIMRGMNGMGGVQIPVMIIR
jgi:hypothetical protein